MKIKKAKVADDLSLKSKNKIKRKSDQDVLNMLNDKRESKYAKVKDSPYYLKYKEKEGRLTDKDRESYTPKKKKKLKIKKKATPKSKKNSRDTIIHVPAKKLILRNRGERVEEY